MKTLYKMGYQKPVVSKMTASVIGLEMISEVRVSFGNLSQCTWGKQQPRDCVGTTAGL